MRSTSSRSDTRSFTLIEMLVAMTILALIMAMMFSLMSITFHANTVEQSNVDNFTRARAMLDAIASDVENGVFRQDLAAFGTQNGFTTNNGLSYLTNGSPATAFYTRIPGVASDSRNLSLVVYKLDGSTNAIFMRDQLPVPWAVPGANWSSTLPFQTDLATAMTNATPQDVAQGVVGFQLFFCRSDQSITNSCLGYQPNNPIISVGVAFVVVDSRALQTLNLTGKLSALTNSLTSASVLTGTNSAKADWDRYIESSAFNKNYPANLGGGLKTFERLVPCNPPF
jgi:prepilin-type N-terminal cleavage/methylation domain-containing protein